MFDPANIRVVRQGVDSDRLEGFVGLRKASDGKVEFCIPYGFKSFDTNNTKKTTQLFFRLYRIFKQYQSMLEATFRNSTSSNDGLTRLKNGLTFTYKEDISITLYSKLASLEAILANYDDLRIFSIETRIKRTSNVDYSQIDKYLHQAVYLDDDVPYVDEMSLPQPFIQYTATDIVRMYCFVYTEIKRQLDEEQNLPVEVRSHARAFRELHLQSDSQLFSPNHETTIQQLRFTLEEIHRQVKLKDDDYWHFYAALETFLYGSLAPDNEGIYWGITTFSPVWEDMCLVYLYKYDWEGVWYADTSRFSNRQIGRFKVFLDPNYTTPFYFELNGKRRYLRPDLVRLRGRVNVNKWFDELFNIEWLSRNSCRISIKKVTGTDISWFNGLDRRLRVHGMRRKRANATSHTYFPISDLKVHQAIQGIKEEYSSVHSTRRLPYHTVTDFKYVDVDSYTRDTLTEKIKYDIIKQMTYEYAIALNAPDNIPASESQFCVPYYYDTKADDIIERVDKQLLHPEIRDRDIVLLKVDYSRVEDVYLADGTN